MAKSVRLKFLPKDRATINSLEKGGCTIVSVSIGLNGTQYEVRYWNNGAQATAWLLEDDLSDG